MSLATKIKGTKEDFKQGIISYIPHPKELGLFTTYMAGRMKGDVTCITGGTSSAKTSFTKYLVFKAIEWAIKNDKNYKVLWFGLEESEEQFDYSLLSFLLYEKTGGKVRYNIENFESIGKTVEDEHLPLIEKIEPLFLKYKSYVQFYEFVSNSYGIYKEIRQVARERGTFYKNGRPFDEQDFMNGIQWDGYKPKDPTEYIEVVIDHLSELHIQKDEKDLKDAMINLVKKLRMYAAKMFKYSVVVVHQQMLEKENREHIKDEMVYSSLQGLGDSKTVARAYMNVIGITNINRYGIKLGKTVNGTINTQQLGDYQRIVELLKRRYGVVNKKIGFYFDGCTNWFESMPEKDTQNYSAIINKIKQYEENRT